MILNMVGGGSSGKAYAVISIKKTANCNVSICTDGAKTVKPAAVSDTEAAFAVPSAGDWVIHYEQNSTEKTKTVTVSGPGVVQDSIGSILLYKEGGGYENVTWKNANNWYGGQGGGTFSETRTDDLYKIKINGLTSDPGGYARLCDFPIPAEAARLEVEYTPIQKQAQYVHISRSNTSGSDYMQTNQSVDQGQRGVVSLDLSSVTGTSYLILGWWGARNSTIEYQYHRIEVFF